MPDVRPGQLWAVYELRRGRKEITNMFIVLSGDGVWWQTYDVFPGFAWDNAFDDHWDSTCLELSPQHELYELLSDAST